MACQEEMPPCLLLDPNLFKELKQTGYCNLAMFQLAVEVQRKTIQPLCLAVLGFHSRMKHGHTKEGQWFLLECNEAKAWIAARKRPTTTRRDIAQSKIHQNP